MSPPLASDTVLRPDLAVVLDTIPQGVLVVSKDHRIHYANMLAEQMFNASQSLLIRHRLEKILSQKSAVLALVDQVFRERTPVSQYRVPIHSQRNRQDQIFDVYSAPLGNSQTLAILTFRERGISDRLARQLDYQGAARAVTGLASMLGHEIKNPLSGIRGAAQLLGSAVPESDKPLADLITSEADRIAKIVDRMEVFSDETPIATEAVNMHAVLGHVRQIAKNGFASHLKIVEDYDPSLPDVAGSRDALVQVFLNLIKNAAETLQDRPGGEIRISSAYRSGVRLSKSASGKRASLPLEFSVADNGDGIPEELQTHIFEPFVTTRVNGSGLGLALVAKTVERHDGIIEFDTGPGGTVFRVLLPAWREGMEDQEARDG